MLAFRALVKSSVTWFFFPVSQASGLHLVHHTWAGTFVLAALCLVFPGLNIVLLDSDCVPVTLFEVEDLWQEAQRLQHCGLPGPVPTSSWAGSLNSDQVDQTALPKPKPQGVILVTEHNAEVNAGFAVLRGSNHAPPLLEEDWQRIPLNSGESQEPVIGEYRKKLVAALLEVGLHNGFKWERRQEHDTIRVPGLDPNGVGAHAFLWTCYGYFPRLGRCLVINRGMDDSHYFPAP